MLWLIPAEDEATGSAAASEQADDVDEAGLFQSGGVLPRAPASIPDSAARPSAGEHACQIVCKLTKVLSVDTDWCYLDVIREPGISS